MVIPVGLWKSLIAAGWTPPPALWLRGEPIFGELAMVWLVSAFEAFEHGMAVEGYWDEEWKDFHGRPLVPSDWQAVCWVPVSDGKHGVDGYREQLLKRGPEVGS